MPKPTPGTDNRVVLVCRLLNRARVLYLLAGAVAGNLHGILRSTKDVDILVPRDRDNAQRLLDALTSLPYGIAGELDADTVARGPITIIGDDPRVDVLTTAASVTYDAASKRKLVRRVDGVALPYLSREDFIRSKQTDRPQDAADLAQLPPETR